MIRDRFVPSFARPPERIPTAGVRDQLIAAGLVRPGPRQEWGDPSPERERPGAPCLTLDHIGRLAAERHRNEPAPRYRREDEAA